MTARTIAARVLLIAEGLVTFPVFLVAWFLSAIWLAVVAGYQFAKVDDDAAKATGLRKMLGERNAP